jgi:membrane-associated phospholipid phosphatase
VLSTIYFGWHYILDDLAGAVIAVMALAFARALTGFRLSPAQREVPALATVNRA